MIKGTYVGQREGLSGKTALLLPHNDESLIKAQFDDVRTGYGYGWHIFQRNEFRIEIDTHEEAA